MVLISVLKSSMTCEWILHPYSVGVVMHFVNWCQVQHFSACHWHLYLSFVPWQHAQLCQNMCLFYCFRYILFVVNTKFFDALTQFIEAQTFWVVHQPFRFLSTTFVYIVSFLWICIACALVIAFLCVRVPLLFNTSVFYFFSQLFAGLPAAFDVVSNVLWTYTWICLII